MVVALPAERLDVGLILFCRKNFKEAQRIFTCMRGAKEAGGEREVAKGGWVGWEIATFLLDFSIVCGRSPPSRPRFSCPAAVDGWMASDSGNPGPR